jgi:tetratricopeptide (TPR) repeat protein
MIEVRLERRDSSLVANAYTRGSNDFSFAFDLFDPANDYSLVIREPGYKELHFALDPSSFYRDPISPTRIIYVYSGIILLELESLPKEEVSQEPLKGPKAVDVRQLQAKISDEARRGYNLALVDIAAGNSEVALTHLEKAIELAPEYHDALTKLGAEYLKSGQYRKAEAILNRACATNPNDPLPLTNLGILFFQEAEKLALVTAGEADAGSEAVEPSYRKAVDAFERALRLDPMNPRANFHLGTVLFKVGAYDRAESLLVNSLTLDGQLHEARLTLVNIYIRQERYDAAFEQISAYLESNPNAPQREQIEKLRLQIESALNQEGK